MPAGTVAAASAPAPSMSRSTKRTGSTQLRGEAFSSATPGAAAPPDGSVCTWERMKLSGGNGHAAAGGQHGACEGAEGRLRCRNVRQKLVVSTTRTGLPICRYVFVIPAVEGIERCSRQSRWHNLEYKEQL